MPEPKTPEPEPEPAPAPEDAGSISPGLEAPSEQAGQPEGQPEGRRGSGVFNANPLLSVTSSEPDTSGDEELARRLELAQQIELAGGGRFQEDGAPGAVEEPAAAGGWRARRLARFGNDQETTDNPVGAPVAAGEGGGGRGRGACFGETQSERTWCLCIAAMFAIICMCIAAMFAIICILALYGLLAGA